MYHITRMDGNGNWPNVQVSQNDDANKVTLLVLYNRLISMIAIKFVREKRNSKIKLIAFCDEMVTRALRISRDLKLLYLEEIQRKKYVMNAFISSLLRDLRLIFR